MSQVEENFFRETEYKSDGHAWQVVVGRPIGGLVTTRSNCIAFFSIDDRDFYVFQNRSVETVSTESGPD